MTDLGEALIELSHDRFADELAVVVSNLIFGANGVHDRSEVIVITRFKNIPKTVRPQSSLVDLPRITEQSGGGSPQCARKGWH